MNTLHNYYKAYELANDKGKMFLHTWMRNKEIKDVIEPNYKINWFYIIVGNAVYFISYKGSTAASGVFGDVEHFERAINLQTS